MDLERGDNKEMKFGQYFTYNNKSSEDFGLAIASFESSDGELSSGLTRNLITGETSKYRFRPNHMGAKYSDPLTFKIGLIKDPCNLNSDDMQIFTRSEVREINRWLTAPSYPTLFHMYDDDYDYADERVDYNGLFSDVEYELNDTDVIGLTFTFTNDSPFAYSPLISKTITSNSSTGTTVTITNDSDEIETPLYPCLVISPKESVSQNQKIQCKIENLTENKSMTYEWENEGNDLFIDCERMVIKFNDSDDLVDLDQLGVKDVGNIYWFRLVSGRNKICVTGDVTVRMQYREYRKVGAY